MAHGVRPFQPQATGHRSTSAAYRLVPAAWQRQGGCTDRWAAAAADGSGEAGRRAAAVLLGSLAALQLATAAPAWADGGDYTITSRPGQDQEPDEQYFETVPQGLAAADNEKAPRLGALIEGPKGKQVQQCVRKCVPTCIRGGQGAPGLGPMSVRREIVVFKEGYRSRKYCVSECTQVCALQVNGKPEAAGGAATSSK